jgi:hypothetical protein
MIDKKHDALVVIATSGSPDYLIDTTGSRRFWPVTVPADGEGCDGIHDEGAPATHLCTRCFPDLCREDLALDRDDEDDYRDEPHEME